MVHLCYSLLYIVLQSITGVCACTKSRTHFHTCCCSLTLLRIVVMATPLREDTQAASYSGEISLSLFYLSPSFFNAHTHIRLLSLPASSICLPPLHSLCPPLSFSLYPCITLAHLSACLPPLPLCFHLLTFCHPPWRM